MTTPSRPPVTESPDVSAPEDDDIVRVLLDLALEHSVVTPQVAEQIEKAIRAEYGGRRFYIRRK